LRFLSPGGHGCSLDCPTVEFVFIFVCVWVEFLVVLVELVEGDVVGVVVEGDVVVVCEPDPDPPPEPDPVPAAKARAAVPSTKVPARAIVRRCFIVIDKPP
jgi:hypothetical protein